MPRAGLSDTSLELLQAAVADPAIVARYSTKTTRAPRLALCVVDGGGQRARSRSLLGRHQVGGRDVVMIAHRFGWALEHGVAALGEAPVLGHRCDNSPCQRRGVGHMQLSSHTANRQERAARRHALGTRCETAADPWEVQGDPRHPAP